MSKEAEDFFGAKPKKTILEDNPKSIDDYDREMLQQFCWDAEHGIEDDEIDDTIKSFMDWRNRRSQVYADKVKLEHTIEVLNNILKDFDDNNSAEDLIIGEIEYLEQLKIK